MTTFQVTLANIVKARYSLGISVIFLLLMSGGACDLPSADAYAKYAESFKQTCSYVSPSQEPIAYSHIKAKKAVHIISIDISNKSLARYGTCAPQIEHEDSELMPWGYASETVGEDYHTHYYLPVPDKAENAYAVYHVKCRYHNILGPEYISQPYVVRVIDNGQNKICHIEKWNKDSLEYPKF